jgi:hypothetical protein
VEYLVLTLNGSLSAERTFTAGIGIGSTDGGANGAYDIFYDSSELTANQTFWSGASATRTVTYSLSGATDPIFNFGNNLFNVTNANMQEGGVNLTKTVSFTLGNCPEFDASGDIVDSGGVCGGAGGNSFGTIGNAVADSASDTLTVTDSGRIDFTTTDAPEDLTADIVANSVDATYIDETDAYAFSSTTNTFVGASYTDGSGAAAGAGVLRCANNVACVAAEAAPAGTDGIITYDATEQWVFNSPISVSSGGTDQVQLGSGTNLSTWQHTFIEFEGATDDGFQTRFSITDPTASRTVTVPNADSTTVQPDTGAANNFLTAISALGVISKAQPAFTNISGTATAGQVPNLESLNGTLDIGSGGTGQTTANPAFNALSPVTTEGDLIYRNATVNARLARGANGECLTASATTILWGSCGAGGNVDLLDGSVHQDTAAGTAVRGDIVTVPASGLWTRLALGGANDIFGSDGTDAAWEAATGTASPVRANNPLFPVQVRFTAMAAPSYAAGNFFYDSAEQAMVFHNDEADIALQIGQEGWVRVRNETGVTITDGKVVYIDGIVSGLPSIALAKADAMSTAQAVGFATHDIEDLSNGFVTLYGVVRDIATTGLTDDIYLSATTAGGMVDSAPSDPNFVVPLGTVVETGATGKVFVNIIAPRPTGGAGIAVSGNSIAVDLLTADDQVGSASNQSGMEFGDTGSDKLALLRGCANTEILKFNTTGGLWECKVDNSGGSPTLDSVAAATGTSSINSGDNAIVWNWQLTTASKNAFEFTENVAGTATGDAVLVDIATLAASTVHPLEVTSRGDADGIRVGATDGIVVALGSGGLDWPALLNYPTGCTNQFVRAILDTPTCNTVGTSDIAAGAADDTIIRDSAGFSVIGKSTTGSGDPADIVAADGTVLGRTSAGNLVFAQVATDQVTDAAVTYAKIQDISATDRLLGRDTAGSGDTEELTVGGGVEFTGSGGIQCTAASTTAVGCPEMAVNTEVDTGTSTTLAVTPDALAGSAFGQVEVEMTLFDFTTAVTTGDGKYFFHIAEGSKLIGMNLISLTAAVVTVSSSGLPTVDVARCAPVATGNPCSGTVVDVLSTDLTIDVNEDSSFTAAAAFAIDTANDDVVEDGMWRIDVDIAGTGTQGLIVTLIFQLP